MYEVKETKVYFKGKKIKADAESFEELIYDFAQDRESIFYKGKAQGKLHRASFKMLDEDYAADRETVYLVMETKLKPTKADPKTFRVLGFGYGCDSEHGYWKDKRLRGASKQLYPIGMDLALDEKGVFWQNRRILKSRLDSRSARAYCQPGFVFVWDESGVWFSEHYWEAKALDCAEPSSFRVLKGQYATDGDSLFYGAREVEDIEPEGFQSLGFDDDLVLVDGKIVSNGQVLDNCDPDSLGTIEWFLYDRNSIYNLNGGELARLGGTRKVQPQSIVRGVLDHQCTLLARLHPIGNRPDEFDQLADYELPPYKVDLEGEQIIVEYEEEKIIGYWDRLWDLSSRLWTKIHFGTSFTRFLHETGTSYPDGDLQVEQVLRKAGPNLFLASAEASQAALNSLTRQVVTSIYHDEDKKPFFEATNYEALRANNYLPEWSSKTTNLARARELVSLGAHKSANPMERHKCAIALYGLAVATDKTKYFVKEIASAVLQQAKRESDGALQMQWLSVLDMIVAHGFLKADFGKEFLYEEMSKSVEFLIDEAFNLDQNLGRMWEIQRFQGHETEVTESRLRDLVGEKRMAPMWSGLHHDFTTLDSWFVAAELRLLKSKSAAERKASVSDLLCRLEIQIRDWREPEQLAELVCDLEDVAGTLKPLGKSLEWPKTPLYTRLSAVEYLINDMSYAVEAVGSDNSGFWIRGWPWGRQIEVVVNNEPKNVHIGLKYEWPDAEPCEVNVKGT